MPLPTPTKMRGKFLPVDKWGPNDQQNSQKHPKTGFPVSTTIQPDFPQGNGVIPNSWMDSFLNNSETFEEDTFIGEDEVVSTTMGPLDEDYIDLELLSNYSTEIYKPTEPSMFFVNKLNPETDLESEFESTAEDSNFETVTNALLDDAETITNAHSFGPTTTSKVAPASDVTTASHVTKASEMAKLDDVRNPVVGKPPSNEMPSDGSFPMKQVPIEVLQSQLMKMLDNLAHKYNNESIA